LLVVNFEQRIDSYRDLINDRLKNVMTRKTPVSFYEPVHYILEGEGKRIRPILVILACKAVGGNQNDSLDAALAIEILHNFTLVHDDIMDRDDLRRGRQTVHKKWDEATAILVGDGLVALAYHYLLKSKTDRIREISDIFTTGIIDLCEGQALDKEFESSFDIDLDQYMNMVELKTARLLMIASEIGAMIGGGDEQQQKVLRDFSRELGCAFQIQDDILDMEPTSRKTFGSDIKQKKKTYLFIHANNNASASIKKQIMDIYQKDIIEPEDIIAIRRLFEQSGSLDFARQVVDEGINNAVDMLQQLSPSEARQDLTSLLNWILERKS
jgi:geranylgeranyl diphosphate synthase type II